MRQRITQPKKDKNRKKSQARLKSRVLNNKESQEKLKSQVLNKKEMKVIRENQLLQDLNKEAKLLLWSKTIHNKMVLVKLEN